MQTIDIDNMVAQALAEDVGQGDVSAALLDVNSNMRATIITREAMVLCGVAWVEAVYQALSSRVQMVWSAQDGEHISAGQTLAVLTGPSRSLVTGERTALNFLQTLSGTATTTARFVDAIAHTRARLLDTRKTLPGLRLAQKYAVRCGGGYNHRIGLYDAFLLKENHLLAAGSLSCAVAKARDLHDDLLLEVEVETLEQLQEALDCDVGRILLDNFSLSDLKAAVALTARRAELEASGGVDLQTLVAIAETGVDYISVGSLTKHLQAIDLSMRCVAAV